MRLASLGWLLAGGAFLCGACSGSPAAKDPATGDAGSSGSAGAAGSSPTNEPQAGGADVSPTQLESHGPAGDGYDGPAVVERSTADKLIIYFEDVAADGSDAPVVRRVMLSRRSSSMPILPVGARVWLSKHPAGAAIVPNFAPPEPFDLSLRAHEDGPLLLGTSFKAPIAPLKVIDRIDGRSEASTSCQDGLTTYQALVIEGDSEVTIDNGQTRTVAIDGEEYDVLVHASRTTAGDAGCNADVVLDPAGVYTLDIQAKNLDALADGLEPGVMPSCAQGNDAAVEISFGIFNVGVSTQYAGSIVYQGMNAEIGPGSLLFEVPELAEQGSGPPLFLLGAPTEAFAPPSPGDTFWLTYSLALSTLRESEQGPLLLLSSYNPAQVLGQLQAALGVPVHPEKSCDYMADYGSDHRPAELRDLVFETEPPVRAKSGERTALTLDGRDYEVWVWGENGPSFTLHAL